MQMPIESNGMNRRAISVVIPVYNEAEDVQALIDEIQVALHGRDYEVIFIDDLSDDDTVDRLSAASARDQHVRVLRLGVRSGKATALAAGFREARGDVIVTMDGDRQDDPANILRLIAKMDMGLDVVSGWKVPRRDPWRRRVASKGFNWAVRRASGLTLHDVNCGMKAYRAAVVSAIVEDCVGDMHRFLPVFAHARGYRVGELQISHRPRANGRSRYGFARYAHGLMDLWVATVVARFSQRPMHALGGVGLIAFLGGCATLGWYQLMPGGGSTLVIAGVALLLLSAQLMIAGVIAEAIVHRHRWPIAYSTVLTLPAEPDARIHVPLSIVRDTNDGSKNRV